MSCITDHGTFLWEGFEGMTGNEKRGLDVVFFEELQQPADTHRSCEDAFVTLETYLMVIGTRFSRCYLLRCRSSNLRLHMTRAIQQRHQYQQRCSIELLRDSLARMSSKPIVNLCYVLFGAIVFNSIKKVLFKSSYTVSRRSYELEHLSSSPRFRKDSDNPNRQGQGLSPCLFPCHQAKPLSEFQDLPNTSTLNVSSLKNGRLIPLPNAIIIRLAYEKTMADIPCQLLSASSK